MDFLTLQITSYYCYHTLVFQNFNAFSDRGWTVKLARVKDQYLSINEDFSNTERVSEIDFNTISIELKVKPYLEFLITMRLNILRLQ